MNFLINISSNKITPFGVTLTNRNYTSSNYRYGFNGMEKDEEVKGSGNSYDFQSRLYDTRLGRFTSVDKPFAAFPHYSPFSFAGNSVIMSIDVNGEGPRIVVQSNYYSVQIKAALEQYNKDKNYGCLMEKINEINGTVLSDIKSAKYLWEKYNTPNKNGNRLPAPHDNGADISDVDDPNTAKDEKYSSTPVPQFYVAFQEYGDETDVAYITLTETDEEGNWIQNEYEILAPKGTFSMDQDYLGTKPKEDGPSQHWTFGYDNGSLTYEQMPWFGKAIAFLNDYNPLMKGIHAAMQITTGKDAYGRKDDPGISVEETIETKVEVDKKMDDQINKGFPKSDKSPMPGRTK